MSLMTACSSATERTDTSSSAASAGDASVPSSGLRGEYFASRDLTGPSETRVDPTIDFDVGARGLGPHAGRADDFGVRWTGLLEVPTSGDYELVVTSDDGARLRVDGELVIDVWNDHARRVDRRTLTLGAGPHPISLEYYERGGDSVIRLEWVRPGRAQEVVPSSALSTADAPPPTIGSGTVQLPIEVLGDDGATERVSFDVPRGSRARRLWMQINNFSHDRKVAIRVNDGAWIELRDDNVEIPAVERAYGGIGGPVGTLRVSVPITGARDGTNTIDFRYQRLGDRVTIGYRVVRFDLLDDEGRGLVPARTFRYDDPSTWSAPRPLAEDIARGRSLWFEGELVTGPGGAPIRARCADCHAWEGHDLAYFNYSNRSIVERARFHGLSREDGERIASYVRTLDGVRSVYARPWNPPYQPGPGLDARGVDEWAAGAGLDAVLDREIDTLPYLFPDGIRADAMRSEDLINFREIPLAFQLFDWKHWLPRVHPRDVPGADYDGSDYRAALTRIRARLESDRDGYLASDELWNDLRDLGDADGRLPSSLDFPPEVRVDPALLPSLDAQEQLYSFGLDRTVDLWDLFTTFRIPADAQRIASRHGCSRTERWSWLTSNRTVFNSSPFVRRIPSMTHEGALHRTAGASRYVSNVWYETQGILNFGLGCRIEHHPVDHDYTYGLIFEMSRETGVPQPVRVMKWLVRSMQDADNSYGVRDMGRGWSFNAFSPYTLFDHPAFDSTTWDIAASGSVLPGFEGVTRAQHAAFITAYVDNVVRTSERFPEPEWQRSEDDSYCGWYLCSRDWRRGDGGLFANGLYELIPRFHDIGADRATVNSLADLMQRLYPESDFRTLRR